jgi:hypothetical protein
MVYTNAMRATSYREAPYFLPPRSAEGYAAALDWFRVRTNPRYAPNGSTTYCNIFVWDVTRSMKAEIPHWVAADGLTKAEDFRGKETVANYLLKEWLPRSAQWNLTEDPVTWACDGFPVVAGYVNPYGKGHVAMVAPMQGGVYIYQAGARCFDREPLASGFGKRKVQFWVGR